MTGVEIMSMRTPMIDAMIKKCILIGAGEWNIKKEMMEQEAFIIAVDGGFDYCIDNSIPPDLIIGDFDSLCKESKEILEKIKQDDAKKVITLPCEKDDTDMLAAIKEGLRIGATQFQIFGGTGKRIEHTIANIQCLLYLKENKANGQLIDGDCKIFVIENEKFYFPDTKKGYLSIFSMMKMAKNITITGMKYPLKEAMLFASYPIGISNEFIGKEASIEVLDGALLIIESKS